MNNGRLKDCKIGEGYPSLIIAEIGINHNGSYEIAKKSISAAAKCGVGAVKFQNYSTEDFLSDKKLLYTYSKKGKNITESLWDICKRNEFKKKWLIPLKRLCDDHGLLFISTPTSERGVLDLVRAGVKIIKNGSDYLTHIPLLRFMGRTGAVVILSTGMADHGDIREAIRAVTERGDRQIVLLHCVSNYPTADKDVNLRRMLALKKRYKLPTGFSDHTCGWSAAVQAVTLGACVIEKHFTIDKSLSGPDHWFSADPKEMGILVREVRSAELRMGKSDIKPADSESGVVKKYRVGLVASRDLQKGGILIDKDIAIRKPASGILPRDIRMCIGKRLTKDLGQGDPITRNCFTTRSH